MRIPSFTAFQSWTQKAEWVPVALRLPLIACPQVLFERLGWQPPHVLLESAKTHPVTGRWSILVGKPDRILTVWGNRIRLEGPGSIRFMKGNPLIILDRLWRAKSVIPQEGWPPFLGGAVGFFSYDLARRLESLPEIAKDDLGWPEMGFLFFDEAVVVDHLRDEVWIIVLAHVAGRDPMVAYRQAVQRLEALEDRLKCSFPPSDWDRATPSVSSEPWVRSTSTPSEFTAMVRRAKAYIAAGEIYQANLSQRLSMPLPDTPWRLYRKLTRINPSPFSAYADLGFLRIVGASPERFLRIQDKWVETRPIAGTRPRGETPDEVARFRRELFLSEKERAEHIMLVDLERNDLGRICRFGSVEVNELMTLEEYSHVIHIVSNVRGILRDDVGLPEIISATFPGGTISGCPKIRSLQVIEELEPVRRHLYTGALGYLSYSGCLDFNLMIRTAFIADGWVHVQVGAGIVADSDPDREYEETLHKAKALLEAFEAAARSIPSHVPVAC